MLPQRFKREAPIHHIGGTASEGARPVDRLSECACLSPAHRHSIRGNHLEPGIDRDWMADGKKRDLVENVCGAVFRSARKLRRLSTCDGP